MTIGLSLNLDPAAIAGNAGLSASVATSKTKGATQGGAGTCPSGPWHCSLSITPQMESVSGFQTTQNCDGITSPDWQPYTILMPQVNSDNLVGAEVDICTCHNYAGWADPGAPGLLCPQDCPE